MRLVSKTCRRLQTRHCLLFATISRTKHPGFPAFDKFSWFPTHGGTRLVRKLRRLGRQRGASPAAVASQLRSTSIASWVWLQRDREGRGPGLAWWHIGPRSHKVRTIALCMKTHGSGRRCGNKDSFQNAIPAHTIIVAQIKRCGCMVQAQTLQLQLHDFPKSAVLVQHQLPAITVFRTFVTFSSCFRGQCHLH